MPLSARGLRSAAFDPRAPAHGAWLGALCSTVPANARLPTPDCRVGQNIAGAVSDTGLATILRFIEDALELQQRHIDRLEDQK